MKTEKRQMRDGWACATDAKRYLGEGLLASVEAGSVPPSRRREALLESRLMLSDVIAFSAERSARKTVVVRAGPIESVAKSRDGCDQALPPPPTS